MQTFYTQVISILAALGVGGLIGVVIKHMLDKKAELRFKLKTINEEKYRTILIYMSIIIEQKNKDHFVLNDSILNELKSDVEIRDYAIAKLKEYYYQSILYASDEVMRSFKAFIENPDRNSYILAAQAMRKDLWNNKTHLTLSEI